jgi:hypothetical protein
MLSAWDLEFERDKPMLIMLTHRDTGTHGHRVKMVPVCFDCVTDKLFFQ